MKPIIENLISLFKTKESKEVANADSEHNYIKFLIDKETKEPYIKMSIKNLSEEDAQLYGELLFDINAGLYQSSIIDILVDFSKEDEKIHKFVMKTIVDWHHLSSAKNEMVSNKDIKPWLKKPQISPLDFNKHAKQ